METPFSFRNIPAVKRYGNVVDYKHVINLQETDYAVLFYCLSLKKGRQKEFS